MATGRLVDLTDFNQDEAPAMLGWGGKQIHELFDRKTSLVGFVISSFILRLQHLRQMLISHL